MAQKKKLQVFVSSTYTDLTVERQAAVEAILKAGHIPAGMELFASGDESQLDTIHRWIDESDVYMLILGARYGSVDPSTALSYTELEYDYAVSKGKPTFAVVITEAAIDRKVRDQGRKVIEAEHPSELTLFRSKVLSRMSSFFDDPKDIKLTVHETISDFLARYEFAGWVSGSEVANATALIEEIGRLQRRNAELEAEGSDLRKTADRASKRAKGAWDDGEMSEIVSALKKIEIETAFFAKEAGIENSIERVGLLTIVSTLRDSLVIGVANKMGMGPAERLLYFNVLPKLEIYGLAASEKVPGVAWRLYKLTPKGLSMLAFLDRQAILDTNSTAKEPATKSAEEGD
jgi:hypothetical protein